MSSSVRVGVIGTSWYADIAHLPRIASHLRAELAAVCGRDRARADEMAQKHGASRVFTDYRAMIAEGDLDAVIVSTPDDTHYPMTMAALGAGKHVLCEKPMALNADDCVEMVEHAEQCDRQLLIAQVLPFFPEFSHALSLVNSGEYGKLLGGYFKRVISDTSQS